MGLSILAPDDSQARPMHAHPWAYGFQKSLLDRFAVHHVGPEDVLLPLLDGRTLVADRVLEQERLPRLGFDAAELVELGRSSDHALVEVDHEREEAPLLR